MIYLIYINNVQEYEQEIILKSQSQPQENVAEEAVGEIGDNGRWKMRLKLMQLFSSAPGLAGQCQPTHISGNNQRTSHPNI